MPQIYMLIATLRGVHPNDIWIHYGYFFYFSFFSASDMCWSPLCEVSIPVTFPWHSLTLASAYHLHAQTLDFSIYYLNWSWTPDLLNVFRPHFQIQIHTSASYILCLVDAVKCHCEYHLQFRASDTRGQQFISLTGESERTYHLDQPYCWQEEITKIAIK